MPVLPAAVLLWIFATSIGYAATFEELATRAATARRSDHVPEALELYRQALGLREDWEEGWWFVGMLSYSAYQYSDCETAFTRFVALDQSRPMSWGVLGLCEFETGHYHRARANLERALEVDGGLPQEVADGARFHHGLLLTKEGFFDRGRRELAHFAASGAKQPIVISGIGLNALRLRLLPKEIPKDQEDAVTRAGQASAAWILGDTAGADRLLRGLVKDYPAMRGVHYLYAAFLSEQQPEGAKAEFQRELKVNPHCAEAHAMLAVLLLPADAGAALANAKEAAAEQPSDALTEFAYGKALVATGALAAGIRQLERAEAADPTALAFHLALATAYSKAGRDDDARRERRTSVAIAKGNHVPE